jgi:sigma-B regulation protein RsbU (phosphoserine phosphatase)
LVDISGKGISAALVTFMVSIIINTIIQRSKSLDTGKIMTEANKVLTDQMKIFQKFACVFLCVYKKSKKKMNFTSCGFGKLHILRKDKTVFDQIENKQIVLGVDPKRKYRSATVGIRKGDAVVLFSDGITDARNNQNKSYGHARFEKVMGKHSHKPVKDILKQVEKNVIHFTGEEDLFDDMSLLVMKAK